MSSLSYKELGLLRIYDLIIKELNVHAVIVGFSSRITN